MGRHSTSSRGSGRWLPWLAALALVIVVSLVISLVTGGGPEDDAATPPTSSALTSTSTPAGPAPTTTRTATTRTATAAPVPPTAVEPPAVTLAFAGDVHFTGRTEDLLDDPGSAFGPIAETLRAADIAMVNLETAITERGQPAPKEFHFRAPPSALDAAAAAGIDVVTMANNHAVDYGRRGLEDTLAAAAASPVPVLGVGPDAATAYAPYRTEVRGVRLAVFGVSQVPDWTYNTWTATSDDPGIASTADRERLLAGVRDATTAGSVVIVYLHWGIEGDSCPTTDMTGLAAELAAAGADAIVGTHAHLLLGAGWQGAGSAYVAYGLGNFLWWRSQAYSDDTGVLTLTVQDGAVTAAQFTPALIDAAGRPQPVTGPAVQDRVAAFDALNGCTDLRSTR